MAKISELKFDDKNFNKHTEFGMSLLEKSLQEFGAGRSILVDKNNRVIAGNGILEAAGQVGIEDIKVIETVGDELVVVKRTDIDLDTKKGREMAYADNQTGAVDLAWDEDMINSQAEKFGFNPDDWGKIYDSIKSEEKFQDIEEKNIVEVYCENEVEQQQIYEELTQRGLQCKIS